MHFIFKWLGRFLFGAVVVIAGVFAFGPVEPADLDVRFDSAVLGDDLDAYFQVSEAAFPDIRDGAHKRVIWAGAPNSQTDIAVLYVHGFSASSEEIRPVPDRIAEALGANLVMTRLSGHGRSGAAMAEPSVNDWMQDVAEALAVARRAGKKVLVLSTSTGGTLVAAAAVDPELSKDIIGSVFVSPNFGINSSLSFILTLPAVRWWGPIVAGAERSFEPKNEVYARHWTTRYPTTALMPLAALVKKVKTLDFAKATIPALFYFSDADKVVNPELTRDIAARWGGKATVMPVKIGANGDVHNHVIAGDIVSPGETNQAVSAMLLWIEGNVQK